MEMASDKSLLVRVDVAVFNRPLLSFSHRQLLRKDREHQ